MVPPCFQGSIDCLCYWHLQLLYFAYWKCNFPLSPGVSHKSLKGRNVTLPSSYRSFSLNLNLYRIITPFLFLGGVLSVGWMVNRRFTLICRKSSIHHPPYCALFNFHELLQVPVKPDGLPEPQVTKVELATSRERFTLPKKLICMNASGSYTAETHQVCFPLIMTHSLYSKARLKSAFLPKNALNAFFWPGGGGGRSFQNDFEEEDWWPYRKSGS